MKKIRLFLSHSSADAALAARIKLQLETAPGVDVLLDLSGLEPDRPWKRDLHEWLARCNGGLVLLTQGVLAKWDWVLKESIILGWRKGLELQHFRLFWALGPGVARADLRQRGFDLAQFDDTQHLKTPAALGQEASLVAELLPLLPKVPRATPLDRLAAEIGTLLRLADAGGVKYADIAAHMGIETPAHWGPDRLEQLAGQLATKLVLGRDADWAVNELILALSNWDPRHRRRLAELLVPHWVDPQAAAALRAWAPVTAAPSAQAAPASTGVAAVAIVGQHVQQFTTRMYVRRAYAMDDGAWRLAPAVDGESADLFAAIRREICEHARKRGWVDGGGDERVVKELRRSAVPIFVPLYSAPDAATLARLHTEFPRVLFVVSEADASNPALVEVEPALALEREDREQQAWQRAMVAIENG